MARKQEAKDPESVGVSVRLPATLLANIDRLAVEERRTRGNLIRLLLEDALKSRAGDSDGK